MRLVVKSLAELGKKALVRVRYEYGESYGIKVMGAWLAVEKDSTGEDIAIFYMSSGVDYFNLDIVQKSLEFYVGELDKPLFTPPIEVMKNPIEAWKERQAEVISSLKEIFIAQGKDETEAMIEAMYAGSDFADIKKGATYECTSFKCVEGIIERALLSFKSVVVKIEKDKTGLRGGNIIVSILEAGQGRTHSKKLEW